MLRTILILIWTISSALVIGIGGYIYANKYEIEQRLHYFWGPYDSEFSVQPYIVLKIPKHVPNCSATDDLRRLTALQLLSVDGACNIQITPSAQVWSTSCPMQSWEEKFHCVKIKQLSNGVARFHSRNRDAHDQMLSTLSESGEWTPWIAADKKFSKLFMSLKDVKSRAELDALVTSITTDHNKNPNNLNISLTYSYNGVGRWRILNMNSSFGDKPFEGTFILD